MPKTILTMRPSEQNLTTKVQQILDKQSFRYFPHHYFILF
ncbi:hypothetical protein VHARVF571_590049 [Vibrio harveyi]|nr:hypothetical protein VHARVF571_590049 [Vibrio harveyi]